MHATKELLTLRVPRDIVDEVRRLAAQESETQSTIFRRLIRSALKREHERRESSGDEAA